MKLRCRKCLSGHICWSEVGNRAMPLLMQLFLVAGRCHHCGRLSLYRGPFLFGPVLELPAEMPPRPISLAISSQLNMVPDRGSAESESQAVPATHSDVGGDWPEKASTAAESEADDQPSNRAARLCQPEWLDDEQVVIGAPSSEYRAVIGSEELGLQLAEDALRAPSERAPAPSLGFSWQSYLIVVVLLATVALGIGGVAHVLQLTKQIEAASIRRPDPVQPVPGNTYRVWRDRQGREIRARIVRADYQTITLRTDDGREGTGSLANLSEEDRAFVHDWLQSSAVLGLPGQKLR